MEILLETTRKHGLKSTMARTDYIWPSHSCFVPIKICSACAPREEELFFCLSVLINLNYYECSVWNYPWLKIPENSTFEKICINLMF
jgi:hypothetical protein